MLIDASEDEQEDDEVQVREHQQDEHGFPRFDGDELWVITSYFNPCNYENRRRNYDIFARSLAQQGVHLLTVELACTEDGFTLEQEDATVMVRRVSADVMWHKERLLNIAIRSLPPSCGKVCWCDCDITFERADWAARTSEALDRYPVVQPFSSGIFLGPGDTPARYSKRFRPTTSFARYYVHDKRGESLVGSEDILRGHPGYAWAARRDVLHQLGGLFDECVIGHADVVMAVGFSHSVERCGPIPDAWEPHWQCGWSPQLTARARAYQRRAADVVAGNIAYLGGNVFHHWHGPCKSRNYGVRGRILGQFNPERDLTSDAPDQPWRWTEDALATKLPEGVYVYFQTRQEDAAR